MILTKTVKVKWNPKHKKYYEELGYTYTKMGNEFEVKVEDLAKNSNIEIECKCDNCGIIIKTTYQSYNKKLKEDGKSYCKKCAIKLYGNERYRKSRLNNSKSFEQWCIENNRQDVLDRWDYELNDYKPSEIGYGSKNKYWLKCNKHKEHKSELKCLKDFTNQYLKGYSGVIECKQCNTLGQYIIDNYREEFLWSIWSDKNNITPFEVSPHCDQIIWWKCLNNKHGDYQRSCDSSVRYEFRCPKCVEEREESILEEKTRLYLQELGYKVLTEYKCSIIPKNPKTKMPLPFDNEIVLGNGKHLIIEVHGSQHYNYYFFMTRKRINKEKAKQELHYQQVKDRYKRIKCKQVGYEYLEIPYSAFDKKETYKTLINNKIKITVQSVEETPLEPEEE